MEAVTTRVEKVVGPTTSVRNFDKAFGDISRLLAHDEERRKSQSSYDKPKYDAGIQRRRLLLLNSIFLAARSLGCGANMTTSKYQVDDPQHRSKSITVGAQRVPFTLEAPDFDKNQRCIDTEDGRLKLTLGSSHSSEPAQLTWVDTDKKKLESCLRDFMVAVLVRAEQQHRDRALRIREWIIERKAAVLEERARQKAEREKREREQREKKNKNGSSPCCVRPMTCKRP